MAETKSQPETSEEPKVAGLVARFEDAVALKAAATAGRDKGLRSWDVHSPFPIHGMEKAMGLRPSLIPWVVLLAGITGGVVALGLQWWTNSVAYPFLISGKPLHSLPAHIPIVFELIVLFSAIATFISVMHFNRLPQFTHSVFSMEAFRRATSDGFFLSIDAADPAFDQEKTREWLESLGAVGVEVIHVPMTGRAIPKVIPWALAIVVVLAFLPPLGIAWYRAAPKKSPRFHPIPDMDVQPKYLTQSYSPFFSDRRTMRLPVPGTIAEGQLEEDTRFYFGKVSLEYEARIDELRKQLGAEEAPSEDATEDEKKSATEKKNQLQKEFNAVDLSQWVTKFPRPVDAAMMERGQERFNVYCMPCHGLDGNGRGPISVRALAREEMKWVLPVSLTGNAVAQQPVGRIFDTITNGRRTMPAYGPQIPPEDRWAIILYVRALERSQNATMDDVPEELRTKLR